MFSYVVVMVTKKATAKGAKTHPICKCSSNLTKACRMKGIGLFCSKTMSLGGQTSESSDLP